MLVFPIPSNPSACLISAHVKHSLRLSSPPLHPWVVAEKEGTVACAHCNCMAGLGEACSHIAAVLFVLDANLQAKKRFIGSPLVQICSIC